MPRETIEITETTPTNQYGSGFDYYLFIGVISTMLCAASIGLSFLIVKLIS